ncbi:MAG: transketolase [Alphaproteobacteria bacterium]|jgi:transketolase|nr:transketolase [Alphaproteobacteria bacterium]MBT5828342.1 transketolase [Alphaproteobacteria bacterium]
MKLTSNNFEQNENSLLNITEQELANAIRALAMDAVEKAKSGHPGLPLGFADVATILFKNHLKFSSKNPTWANRDRFILSAGHGSMLIYALAYLCGYEDITLDDLKDFRQLGAKTAGHPEVEMLEAIETTTGPLGQGLANGVGMAFAERLLSARFPNLIDHFTYVMVGDGCLMEGISQESISFAGHHKLNKLIVLFDDNNICIDGEVSLTSSEDQKARFKACGWNVIAVDGHNHQEIDDALNQAKRSDKPTMIACKTIIAYGSPNKSASAKSHGSPLGEEEIKLTKAALNWPYAAFEIPDNILSGWHEIGLQGKKSYEAWQAKLDNNAQKDEFNSFLTKSFAEFEAEIIKFKQNLVAEKKAIATRQASGEALELFTKFVPQLIGGSADLTGSNNTKTSNTASITTNNYNGRYVHYGIREHAMGAIMNGMALYGGFIPYSGTFLVFSDYCKPAIRLSALMEQQVIYVFTHDSIGLGEDGPTHQPIEHLDALRLVPNLVVIRPCDTVETLEAWQLALNFKDRPVALSLTRQALKQFSNETSANNNVAKGGYIIAAEEHTYQATIVASGSEVEIAMQAKKLLEAEKIGVRVVSMPSVTLFAEQSKVYIESCLGKGPKVAIEASRSYSFDRYVDKFIGMNSFGASGKASDLYEHFGLTAENIIKEVKNLLC